MWKEVHHRVASEHGSTLGLDGIDACRYACIVMVKVVMHEVISSSLCHNDSIGKL